MNKLYLTIFLLVLFSCSSKNSEIETEVVKNHTLHLEEINAETNIVDALVSKGLSFESNTVYDSRLLQFYGIYINSMTFTQKDNFMPDRISLTLLKESENEDADKIRSVLVQKYGEPEISEHDSTKCSWTADKMYYSLKIAEKGYSNPSTLDIYFDGSQNRYW